jgi:flagellar basal body-associated protein FliL
MEKPAAQEVSSVQVVEPPAPVPGANPVPKSQPRWIGIIAVVVIVVAVAAAAVVIHNSSKTTSVSTTSDQTAKTSATDTQSLTKDLNDANSSIGASSQDLQDSSTALNDQQPTITAN